MNKLTLQNIANHTNVVSVSEIEEIKQLIGAYPFYSLPHVVLAKIYFEKEHYLFENALNQAAMRVNDREWLYHYIHGDEEFDKKAIDASLSQGFIDNEVMEHPSEITESDAVEEVIQGSEEASEGKNDLSEFLNDLEISEPIRHENLKEEIGEFETAVQNISEEATVIGEVEPINTEANEVAIEFEKEEEAIEIEAEDLDDEIRPPIIEPIEFDELENEAAEELLDEGISEEVAVEARPGIDLRKHPVYNVEAYLTEDSVENSAEFSKNEDSEKDFFYWLNHPKPAVMAVDEAIEEVEEKLPTDDHALSIIEQFIKANPSISRPKKEFFSAENMAKRSENLDFEYVTETLANIYYEQGNIDLAINAYEKLSLQNPLKQAYFASLIEKIKKEKR
ncbi:MAG: hypothetical protein PSX81_09475 [bacterium]|nr:hypothetical protein [bacterium]